MFQNSIGKENLLVNKSYFISPKSFKYESPSKLLDLNTPIRTPNLSKFQGGIENSSNFKFSKKEN